MSTSEQMPTGESREREHTDESLRSERKKADDAIEQKLDEIDTTADALIIEARARADALLAKERHKADRRAQVSPAEGGALKAERASADEIIRRERAEADEAVRDERATHVALLAHERRATDENLLSERESSDIALESRDDILGRVSHDLRNMLANMMGFAQLIVQRTSEPQAVASHAQRILSSGNRMNRLIGDLLDVASIAAGAFTVTREPVDPSRLVNEAVESFQPVANAHAIQLTSEILSPPGPAALDGPRILQVLTNLIANAIKFTPPNGRVVVRLERTPDAIQFSVADTGRGIPADKLETLFERFYQMDKSDRRGIGLGLYVSRSIVQTHGGRIWAESTVGVGSTFRFVIPTKP
ncbi:MAG TPA: HAMP domain-containing sensor histidine kinase [Polyangiaceae bacterium]|nr:HAMP domain-containing sensor histidine kinase [Polyangiaceae bacterium]